MKIKNHEFKYTYRYILTLDKTNNIAPCFIIFY